MIPPAIVRALTNPPLDASDFTPTKWDTGEDKARFGNALLKFIANDCPRTHVQKGVLQAPVKYIRTYRL